MTKVEKEKQILRIKEASFQNELSEALQERIRTEVVATIQAILEEALVEEVKQDIAQMDSKPRRSGYFQRTADTHYGRIEQLSVPKLRHSNKERQWQILERYQRGINGFIDQVGYLYTMGLSLRDMQEALYLLMGQVLSPTAINKATLRVQTRMETDHNSQLETTPPILIVDGVWVDIQYTQDAIKIDRAGHQRQQRQAEERVILAVMAVWPDGRYHILHYEVADNECESTWSTLFDNLIARGLLPQQVKLVVSDGTNGLLSAMRQHLPDVPLQRCITHKVRGMKPYLTYEKLPTHDADGFPIDTKTAKSQRWSELKRDAYDIYDADSLEFAQQRLTDFSDKWTPLEPRAIRAFKRSIQRTFCFYAFDKELAVHIRTSNHLERFFREFRNRADEIGAFPNETSCLTLFYLVMLRDHAKHQRFDVAKTS